ncbi:FABP family protein [Protaetiibacter mangrovi]|uniref:Peroxynitrite isomerase n=1 Tax=Protaetiibacter mangrovi TaxID=2970926 RepID=A0ABT1ZDM2_9MICO|nr:FABP family protein [Protaetiibacter mangrovi]MCS0498784.1 FABP family protein [Protaetiibacter mangrovi]TPX04994.1 FABP family protein [Schumannella luteola]
MFELDVDLPAELVPLSWLIGVWEGSGVVAYKVGDEVREHEFGQRVAFSHDGTPHLQYSCTAWLLPETDAAASDDDVAPHPRHLFSEIGYWRLSRPLVDADDGPAMLPGTAAPIFRTADAVETLRNGRGAFDIEVMLVQPGGVSELYLGEINGPRIDLATDAVLRSGTAKDYAAATRLYGLVDDHLLWAWDIAALGQDLRTHASGRLGRVE